MSKISKIRCHRCGKCCIVKIHGQWVDCSFLIKYMDDKTRCMIYRHRVGAIVAPGQFCLSRVNVHFNYPDCAYNRHKWPLHPKYIK